MSGKKAAKSKDEGGKVEKLIEALMETLASMEGKIDEIQKDVKRLRRGNRAF